MKFDKRDPGDEAASGRISLAQSRTEVLLWLGTLAFAAWLFHVLSAAFEKG